MKNTKNTRQFGHISRFARMAAVSALWALLPCALPGCAARQNAAETGAHAEQASSDAGKSAEKAAPRAQTAPDVLPDVTRQPDETPLLRLAVISDMNGRYGSDQYDAEVVKAIDMIIEERPDIVINAGDMVAGQKNKLNYRKMWAGFHAAVTQRLADAKIPMAQIPGNHDASGYERYAKEREIYIDEWTQRKPDLPYADDSRYPLYYSFVFKDVFFVALDATTLDPLDDEQYAWLEKQLSSNPTPNRPVVFFHVPLFPITTIKPTEILRDGRLEPLFAKHRVQLVINGHQQAYFPAALNGVIYLHAGALGGGPRPVRQNDGIAPKTLTFVNLYKNHPPYIDSHLVDGAKGQHFNHNLLPTYIVFGNKILPRVDMSLENATFARDYMISPHMPKIQTETLIGALKANGGDWSRIPSFRDETAEADAADFAGIEAEPDTAAEETDAANPPDSAAPDAQPEAAEEKTAPASE